MVSLATIGLLDPPYRLTASGFDVGWVKFAGLGSGHRTALLSGSR